MFTVSLSICTALNDEYYITLFFTINFVGLKYSGFISFWVSHLELTCVCMNFMFYLTHVLYLWTGRVEIVDPYHPLYIKAGTTLTIVCQSAQRTTIEWVQNTAETSWKDVQVAPRSGQDFVVQTCTDEPSGFSKSTLLRSNMSINGRGMYQCKEQSGSSSYAIWVTVLYSMLITHFFYKLLCY